MVRVLVRRLMIGLRRVGRRYFFVCVGWVVGWLVKRGEEGGRRKGKGRGKREEGERFTFLGSWKLTCPVAMDAVLRRLDHGV